MYYAISVITGILIAVMVFVNGDLTNFYGVYSTTALIHVIGLIFISIIILIKKDRFIVKEKLPLLLYTGGAIGYLTTLFDNLAFGGISVSALLALSLFGQCITSIILDQFGLMGMPKRPLIKQKFIGIGIVLVGIVFMLFPMAASSVVPVILCLSTGITVVVSRTVNADLSAKSSVWTSTFYNYATGLIVSLICILLLGRNEAVFTEPVICKDVLLYTGGLIGVFTVILLNMSVTKISAFYMTLFLFVGQISAGIVIDILISHAFSQNNLIGGICVAAGLIINFWFDKRVTAQ